MAVASPQRPCFYFECSHGSFRLSYFIPPSELKALIRRRKIADVVLEDFPDGVDLDCTDLDFAAFSDEYGYRPRYSPEALCNAFYAILSTTRAWSRYRGTGFVTVDQMDVALESIGDSAPDDDDDGAGPPASLRKRRGRWKRRASRKSTTESSLRKLKVQGVNPKKHLHEQEFARVKMGKGTDAEEVFSKLHLKQDSQ